MSITGGFLGAFIAGIIFLKKNKLAFWHNVDYFFYGVPIGVAIGRIGCAFIHDHPGIRSNFFLAVNYPGGPRHDLGLYLVFVNLIIFIIFCLFKKKVKIMVFSF